MSLRPGEVVGIGSIEAFLSDREIREILRSVERLKKARGIEAFVAGRKDVSVHHLDSFNLRGREAARVFTPRGRIEIQVGSELPEVRASLDDAFFRRIEDIRRTHPSATWPRGWTYVEYGRGQHCTTHADGHFNATQVGACSVRLDDASVGGELYVETSGSPALLIDGAEPPDLIAAALYDNPWLRALPKTRWLAQPSKGTALFWGSHLLHGSQPVIRGVAKKIIAWIEAG